MSEGRLVHILLVEDNEGDIVLAQKAFEDFKTPKKMHIARDGETALNMLTKSDEYEDLPEMDLILLDINLPRIDGPEVLQRIKNDPALSLIPVVMLSSSTNPKDILKSYECQASSYIVKAQGLKEFKKIAQAVEICWFRKVGGDFVDQVSSS